MDRKQVLAAFSDRYVEVQYAFVQFLTEHLADCARTFGGDLELMLVLGVLGQAHLSAVMARPADGQNEMDYGMSALRVADVTGLPRETARRKLAKLAERGWIRQAEGGWRLVGQSPVLTDARRDLGGLDGRALERLARLHCDLGRLLNKPVATEVDTQNG